MKEVTGKRKAVATASFERL
uniref:Uncharacterized protein n=1 Tax=Anopheles minimus TaxID=112268 RepID=A0A182WQE4_9DIPT